MKTPGQRGDFGSLQWPRFWQNNGSLNLEYLLLVVGVVASIRSALTAQEVKTGWLLKAADKDEASKFATLSPDLGAVIEKLFHSNVFWHPTARMRLVQYLFHRYGVDEVAKAIEAAS